MDLYRQQLLDHYKHPKNWGHLENPDSSVEEGNVTCGDNIVIEIQVNREKTQSIKDIRFTGEGCAVSQASASMLTEKVKGMDTDAVMRLTKDDIMEMLGMQLTPSRTKCAMLSLEVLHKAILSLKRQ